MNLKRNLLADQDVGVQVDESAHLSGTLLPAHLSGSRLSLGAHSGVDKPLKPRYPESAGNWPSLRWPPTIAETVCWPRRLWPTWRSRRNTTSCASPRQMPYEGCATHARCDLNGAAVVRSHAGYAVRISPCGSRFVVGPAASFSSPTADWRPERIAWSSQSR